MPLPKLTKPGLLPGRDQNGEEVSPVARDIALTPKGQEVVEGKTRTATTPHPRLVNRGGAGLLHKKSKVGGEIVPTSPPSEEKAPLVSQYQIHPSLKHLAVAIDELTPDPMNARIHPADNMKAIKASLTAYGQRKPIVVREEGMVVVAGNGTLQAAKDLGWTEIAATVQSMTDHEFAGYGLADNRSAESAQWDFKVVAMLDKLLQEVNDPMPGWSTDHLEVLREAVWLPPSLDDGTGEGGEPGVVSIVVSAEQYETFKIALDVMRQREGKNTKTMSDGEVLQKVCEEWLPQPGYVQELEAEEQANASAEEVPDEGRGDGLQATCIISEDELRDQFERYYTNQ